MLKNVLERNWEKIRLKNKTKKGYDTFPKSIIYNFENTDEESTLFSIATGNSPLATPNSQLATPQLAFFPPPKLNIVLYLGFELKASSIKLLLFGEKW